MRIEQQRKKKKLYAVYFSLKHFKYKKTMNKFKMHAIFFLIFIYYKGLYM